MGICVTVHPVWAGIWDLPAIAPFFIPHMLYKLTMIVLKLLIGVPICDLSGSLDKNQGGVWDPNGSLEKKIRSRSMIPVDLSTK